MNNSIIIVAGGSGTRMGATLPKQFIEVGGKPILMHTIERFAAFDATIDIVVVIPEEHHLFWHEECKKHHFTVIHKVAAGGKERFYSVKNGLDAVSAKATVIGVHDGVRPLVSTDTIKRCFDTARATGSAIPTTAVVESLRHRNADGTTAAVPRAEYLSVQTPQCFDADLLRRAYHQQFSPLFTDDASVVEALGHPITTIDGDPDNIKITTPKDLAILQAHLSQ